MLDQILGGIGSVLGAGLNYLNQRSQFQYEQQLQEKTWDREDNAVQRRVADLEAAGLSPTLAAGSSAQTSAPIKTQVPGAGIGNQVAEAMQFQTALARQKQDIATSAAQEKLNDIQAENAALQTMPIKEALKSPYLVNAGGNEMKPAEYLGYNYLLQMQNALAISSDNATASMWNAQRAITEAKQADISLNQKAWDFDITQKTGMRSYDQGLNGPLEAVIRSLGGSGTPYGSAYYNLISQILRSLPRGGGYVR